MPTATITVRYADPPKEGKKMATVKDGAGQIFGVYPEKLSEFQVNGIYEVEYDERQWEGRTFRTIKSAAKKGEAPRPMGRPGAGPRETSAKDAERMFVCSLVNAAIQAGKVEFNQAHIETAVNGLRRVWANTFGAQVPNERPH